MKNKKTSILETEECKLAHVDYETKRCQSMQEHAGNVARFAKDACELPELRSIVNWQEFFMMQENLAQQIRMILRIFWNWEIRYINMDWIILPRVEELHLN